VTEIRTETSTDRTRGCGVVRRWHVILSAAVFQAGRGICRASPPPRNNRLL